MFDIISSTFLNSTFLHNPSLDVKIIMTVMILLELCYFHSFTSTRIASDVKTLNIILRRQQNLQERFNSSWLLHKHLGFATETDNGKKQIATV